VRKFKFLLVMMGGLLLVPALWAGLIYDNGAPDGQTGNEMTEWIQAEDFTLAAPTTLTGVRFWAFPYGGTYAGSIAWRIYADNSGEPGAVVDFGVVVPTRVYDHDALGVPSYQHDFALSVALGAGTYWLGLHNGLLTETTRLDYYWETTGSNATLTGQEDHTPFDTGGWLGNEQEHAFQLYGGGGGIPEPSTWLLLGAGLISLAALARRRRP